MAGDTFEFETGLADDFDFEVQNAYFQYSPKLVRGGEPQMALHLEGKAEGGTFESPAQLAEDTALLFSVGKGWLIVDDGARLVHESGSEERRFNVSSAIARLIKSAIDVGVPLKDRGTAFETRLWLGLQVHFKRKAVQYGGEIGEKQVLVIEKYFGEAEKAGRAKEAAPAASEPAAGEKAPAGDDVTFISDAVGGAIFKRLEKLAGTAEDYETWAAEASELPKVKDSDEVQEIILDETRGTAVWEALRG